MADSSGIKSTFLFDPPGKEVGKELRNEHSLKGDSETWYHFADGRLVRSTGTTRSRHDKQLPD